jgi:hypothetical protein
MSYAANGISLAFDVLDDRFIVHKLGLKFLLDAFRTSLKRFFQREPTSGRSIRVMVGKRKNTITRPTTTENEQTVRIGHRVVVSLTVVAHWNATIMMTMTTKRITEIQKSRIEPALFRRISQIRLLMSNRNPNRPPNNAEAIDASLNADCRVSSGAGALKDCRVNASNGGGPCCILP